MSEVALIDIAHSEELSQLKLQIEKAEEESARLTLQIADIKLEIRRFQTEYSARVGPLYAELDEIELKIREYQLRTEMIRSGTAPDSDEIQDRVTAAFEADRERLHAYQARVREAEKQQAEKSPDSRKLRGIYLRLAKRYHPDKAATPEERDRNARMMTLINQAYEDGDRITLERLASEGDIPASDSETPGEQQRRLKEQLDRIRHSIIEMKRDIEAQQQSDVYLLKRQVETAREQGEDLLNRLTRDIQYKIAAARRRLGIVQNLFERWSRFLKGRAHGAG